jgi:hypothetical protein
MPDADFGPRTTLAFAFNAPRFAGNRQSATADPRWLAEPVIGPRFARTRWLAPQGDGSKQRERPILRNLPRANLQTGSARG